MVKTPYPSQLTATHNDYGRRRFVQVQGTRTR